MQNSMVVLCPQCDGSVEVPGDAIVGEIVSCPDCGTSFEVTAVGNGKASIKAIEMEGEDWGE